MLQSLIKNDERLSSDNVRWNAILRPLGRYSKDQRSILMAQSQSFSRYCSIHFLRRAGYFLQFLGNAAR